MKLKNMAVVATIVGVSFASSAFAAERDEKPPSSAGESIAPAVIWTPAPALSSSRPAILPALYASFGAMQAWDIYSTSQAMKVGAREANPVATHFTKNNGAMIGMKVAATASTILFSERLWKKNKVAAVVLMASINGATAAVSMHNMRNAGR